MFVQLLFLLLFNFVFVHVYVGGRGSVCFLSMDGEPIATAALPG